MEDARVQAGETSTVRLSQRAIRALVSHRVVLDRAGGHNRDGAAKRRNGNGDRHHTPRSEWKGRREREGGDAPRPNQGRGTRRIETYVPLIYADRLELNRRVRRVTTVPDGSQTVEETEERNPGSPSEPLRVVQRSVTTVCKSGNNS